MSKTKKFLENVSHDMGYGGAINSKVMAEGSKRLETGIKKMLTISSISEGNNNDERRNNTLILWLAGR